MKKVLDDTFLPTDVLLLVPLESRNKANGFLRDDFLDMANIANDPKTFLSFTWLQPSTTTLPSLFTSHRKVPRPHCRPHSQPT